MMDEFLDLKSGINLVYGEAASGKTTLALMLAYNYSKFSKVIFVDTENGFNFERFKQISQENYNLCLNNILLYKANSFDELFNIINNFENTKEINLIIIDTIGMHYRLELKKNVKEVNNKMLKIMQKLRLLNKSGINIFLTNQVYRNIYDNSIQSVGGNIIKRFSKFIVKLEKNPRKISREKPSNYDKFFEIRDEGLILR